MLRLSPRLLVLAGMAGIALAAAILWRTTVQPSVIPEASAPVAPLAAAPPTPAPTGNMAVVATRDIPRGGAVVRDALRLTQLPGAPAGAYDTLDAVADHIAVAPIARGQAVTPSMISALPDNGGVAPLVPPMLRAVTLHVAEDTGVGYLIRPGDRVDVELVTRDDADGISGIRDIKQDTPNFSRLVLQDVQVLAIGDVLTPLPPGNGNSPAARATPLLRNVTLAVTPEQSLLVGLSRGDGGYVLTLRNPDDHTLSPDLRASRSDLLADAPSAPPPPQKVALAAPRPVRTGPEILRGPVGGTR
jgi:pilus assembly protein CpaB